MSVCVCSHVYLVRCTCRQKRLYRVFRLTRAADECCCLLCEPVITGKDRVARVGSLYVCTWGDKQSHETKLE